MNCRFHNKSPCPECSMDGYKAEFSECTAGQFKKTMCLDGLGCWCRTLGKTRGRPTYDELLNENRRLLTALESVNRIASDMLDPVRRAGPSGVKSENNQMRGSGMSECRSTRSRNESNVEEKIWEI